MEKVWLVNLVGDFLVELGISLWSWGFLSAFLIRGCIVHRVRVLGDFSVELGDFSVELGISQCFLIGRSVAIE